MPRKKKHKRGRGSEDEGREKKARKNARRGKRADDSEEDTGSRLDLGISSATKSSILVVLLFVLALLSMLAFFDKAGAAGEYFVRAVEFLFGRAGFLIPLTFFGGGIAVLFSFHKDRHAHIVIGLVLFLLSFLGIFAMSVSGDTGGAIEGATIIRPAGIIGQAFAYPFERFLGDVAGIIVLIALFLISILITFDISLRKLATGGDREDSGDDQGKQEGVEKSPGEAAGPGAATTASTVDVNKQDAHPDKPVRPKKHATFAGRLLRFATHPAQQAFDFKKRSVSGGVGMEEPKEEQKEILAVPTDTYEPPPLTLIESTGEKPKSGDIEANKAIIQRTFEEFGFTVEMGEVKVGPSITQFTLRPPKGVNLAKIMALQSNVSLNLAAHPIRIEAPIPGQSLVGIEVPNKKAATVRLFEMLKALQEFDPPSRLSFAIGKDVSGAPIFTDLGSMPHLLIAGATGSGKSIGVNNILLSLIYRNSPDMLKFILIDPKRVELTLYNGIPHLLAPVVVDSKKSINVLKWATQEMDRRYEMLAELKVRNIEGYNEKIEREGGDLPKLPFIVIVIDEMADIMSMYKKEVEAIIVRLAQMARAVGIHLIASTQ
ncbi:MAG: hypothetical protein A2666_01495, partial [Parcubacteria group bacterium RIFCSPHIGHO2_01_FULL_47_10b]